MKYEYHYLLDKCITVFASVLPLVYNNTIIHTKLVYLKNSIQSVNNHWSDKVVLLLMSRAHDDVILVRREEERAINFLF